MKPKPTELPQQQQPPIRFKHNVIVPVESAPGGSRFFEAGQPTPYREISEVPPNLRAFVVSDGDEPEREVEGRANFELGTVYMMTESGQRGRALSRQVAQMETENELEIGPKSDSQSRFRAKSPTPCKLRTKNPLAVK